jgi:hypothetical protein
MAQPRAFLIELSADLADFAEACAGSQEISSVVASGLSMLAVELGAMNRKPDPGEQPERDAFH